MAIEGTLEEFRLPEILQMVAQQQKTGILTIQGESTIVAVSFLGGRVVAADSLEETVEERLGEVLVADGLLDRDAFAEVSQRQRRGEGRLIDLLVSGDYLSREQILASLRRQTEGLLRQLLEWEQGEFKFYGNDEVSFEEGFQPISVEDLLLSSLPEPDDEPAAAFPRAVPDAPPAAGADQAAAGKAMGWQERDVLQVDATGALTGGEEILVPPPMPARPVLVKPEAAPARRGAPPAALVPLLAAGLAAAVVAALLLVPGRFLLPLPWQNGERLALLAVQRQAAYQSIDRSAKTFFLLEGRFPDDLSRLVGLSLLAPWELQDPSGVALRYTPLEDSYEVGPAPAEEREVPAETTSLEAITGNFLLDPEFLSSFERGDRAPLVLLD